ncbi:MAG TPA: hypothetical protein ENK51_00405 [Gammaproteobacteria bacterium]|nr:hypothetical protein [Gammaproteobacteria bacterium]
MSRSSLFSACLIFLSGCGGSNYESDPLVTEQWYLSGSDLDGNMVHINLNQHYYKGRGVLVATVDNGIDVFHEDLRANIGEGSYSYLPEEYGFSQKADHGTATAVIIAAIEGNGKGIKGIAPQVRIIGFNALRLATVSNLADALVREKERVWISNNSWGDINSWGEPLALKSLIRDALIDGVTDGRSGRGIAYVFAAGNGDGVINDLPIDNVNYSGLVNNRYTIPICAVDEYGKKAAYSEKGATLIVCAPSKGRVEGVGITTTDVTGEDGYNPTLFPDDFENRGYTGNFGGTSAAAPMVSGVVALMLEANSRLSWRDVRIILARSARRNDSSDSDWVRNGAGYPVNHKYGFGLVDADRAVQLAKEWAGVGDEKILEYQQDVGEPIPDGENDGVQNEILVDEDLHIEFVEVFFDASDHPNLGDLDIVLTSPEGTESVLAEQHNEMFGVFQYNNWRFGTMRHLGERSRGKWQLKVVDKAAGGSGTFINWRIKVYGTRENHS